MPQRRRELVAPQRVGRADAHAQAAALEEPGGLVHLGRVRQVPLEVVAPQHPPQFGVVPQEEGGPPLELHQFRVGLARLLAAGVVDDLARLDRRDDARPAAHLLPVRGAPHRALPPGSLCLPVLVRVDCECLSGGWWRPQKSAPVKITQRSFSMEVSGIACGYSLTGRQFHSIAS